MNTSTILISSVLLLGPATVASAQVVSFELLADTSGASDMTPDGRYITGRASIGGSYILDTWTGAITTLPDVGSASAISDDGTIVVGSMDNPDGVSQDVAGMWTAETGWVSLGTLPGAMGACGGLSNAYEISADGSVVTGLSASDGCVYLGFRWTEADGMLDLQSLANGICRSSVLSADGSLMGGFCQGSFSRTPTLWTTDTSGILLDPPSGDVLGEVHALSDDGSLLLGSWNGQGFVFDDDGGQEFFNGTIASWTTAPTDVADNGTIVGRDSFMQSSRGWIRPQGSLPVVPLLNYMSDLGVPDLPPSMDFVAAISTDGRKIIGSNFFSNGWLINLCVPDLDGSGAIDFGDLLKVLSDWDKPSSESPADLDGSGFIDFGDLLVVLSTWGPCPATTN